MKLLGTYQDAHDKVLADARRCIERVRQLSASKVETAEQGVHILQALREEIYEDMNQIQHEHMILRAVRWLVENNKCPDSTEWYWNPRQTGGAAEPDLRGVKDGIVIVSAEITTSRSPVGIIDSRMRKTLSKLAEAEGSLFYFVISHEMHQRAITKIRRNGWEIEAVLAPVCVELGGASQSLRLPVSEPNGKEQSSTLLAD